MLQPAVTDTADLYHTSEQIAAAAEAADFEASSSTHVWTGTQCLEIRLEIGLEIHSVRFF